MDQTGKDPIASELDLNQWLESALGQYSKAKPRAGLENRILASVEAERSRIATRRRWWWPAGMAVAAATIVLAVWLGHGGRSETSDATAIAAGTGAGAGDRPATPRDVIRATVQPAELAAAKAVRQPATHRTAGARQVGDVAKLDQFPSRRNLSEGESLLAQRLNEQSTNEALLESISIREEVDMNIDSLEIRPLQIPDIEISESETN